MILLSNPPDCTRPVEGFCLRACQSLPHVFRIFQNSLRTRILNILLRDLYVRQMTMQFSFLGQLCLLFLPLILGLREFNNWHQLNELLGLNGSMSITTQSVPADLRNRSPPASYDGCAINPADDFLIELVDPRSGIPFVNNRSRATVATEINEGTGQLFAFQKVDAALPG
jgi:hypothetical protein